jgi:homoserine kinase type II
VVAKAVEPVTSPAGRGLPPQADGQVFRRGSVPPRMGNWRWTLVTPGWRCDLGAGEPITGRTPSRISSAGLAAVHGALAGCAVERAQRFHWVDRDAEHLALRPWLRPAIGAALDALDAARPDDMTWGLLHADPAPEAFRLDPATGRCGIIDWSYALYGPLLYDVASAVMYVGGPGQAGALLRAYRGAGILPAAEIEHGLAPMLRFRWAVQADYFAWRIAVNNLTGIAGPQDNEKGLEDARRFLIR